MTEEVWRDLPGFDGWYEVSDQGRVRSWHMTGRGAGKRSKVPRIMKSSANGKYGYQHLCLRSKQGMVDALLHRLVLETFVGPAPPGSVCCHLDNNPRNNRLTNLKWGTPKENEDHKWLHGTQWRRFGNVKTDSNGSSASALRRRRRRLG